MSRDKEKQRIYSREYYKNNSEKVKAAVRKYREKNPERINDKNIEWRKNNIDKAREISRKYGKAEFRNAATDRIQIMRREQILPTVLIVIDILAAIGYMPLAAAVLTYTVSW